MRLSSGKNTKNSGGTSDSGDKMVDSTRRSERLGKQTQTQTSSGASPAPRKSTRLEQQSTPSPVRRSGRIQTQSSSAEKASSPIDSQKKKGQKEKTVQQLNVESAGASIGDTDNSTKRKAMNARKYKALFKKQKKLKGGEDKFEQHNHIDSLDNSASISPLEHRENGNLNFGHKGIEPPLEVSVASSSKESNEKVHRIDVEPEFAYLDQSFSDEPHNFSVRADVDESLIGCTNTETVKDVRESPKDHSILESGSCALPLEVDSSRIVANKKSPTLVVEGVASASASTEQGNDKTNGFGADCLNSNLVNVKEISVAHGLKTNSSKFVEYWVPVPVSNVQLEYYCATLFANAITLCSPLKKDHVGVLPKILKTVQKYCDHPNLVDSSLHRSIMKDFTPHDSLNVDIMASGKLQLLDMILSKCRRPKLKVLILYSRSVEKDQLSPELGIGDVLDDYMRQKFGENSYGRLESSFIPAKRQETLLKFNDKGSEQFVLLLEHRACSSSLKLLLVDFVIIFNTELSLPANELKEIQRMSIAQSKQIKVFRLYSCHTLEEKLLILAKHHKSVNILDNTNRTMSLLMWGTSVLFNRLDKFHAEQNPSLSLDCLSGQQSLLDDTVKTIMHKIINDHEDNFEHDSIISRAFFDEGVYHMDKLLLGEKDVQPIDGVERQLFWKNLLEGQKPRWKFWGPTSRSRKRVTYDESSEAATKHQKLVDTRFTSSSFHPVVAVPKADSDQPTTSENEQTILHVFLKDEMEKLCVVLQLSIDIKQMVGAFLEYVIKNHQVNKEPVSILHAFQISLCWASAKILKKSMNKRETLMRAKNALDFQCTDEEAYLVYEKLRALKKTFQQLQRKNGVSLPSQNVSASPGTSFAEVHPLTATLDVQNGKVKDEEVSCSLEMLEEPTPDELNGSCLDEKIKKLQKQHEKEILDFHKRKEQEKSRLESDHQIESAFIRKTYSQAGTARSMLMQLDNELKKEIQEHANLIEVQFEELQMKHSAEKKKMVDEWRTKEISIIASSNSEKEVPSASHTTEKQNPKSAVQDNGTENLITHGASVTIADNAARSETSLCTPVIRVPNEPLRIKRAGAQPALLNEQPEETSQRSTQIQTIVALEAGGSGVSSDTSLCIPVNSIRGELLEIEPRGVEPLTVMERPEETNQISHQIPTDCAGGSESSLCTLEDEVLGVVLAGSEPVTVVQPEEASQASPQTRTANAQKLVGSFACPDKVLEIEHARVEPVKVVQQSEESSSQNNDPSAVPGTVGSEVGDDRTSEMIKSLEVETGDGGGNPVGSNRSKEPLSVPGPTGSESGNGCFSEIGTYSQVETRDTPKGYDATGDQNVPTPQPSAEVVISLPMTPSKLPQNNVHEKTGTLASDCNKLLTGAVNHVHIESTNALLAPSSSVQMVEGSTELPHQAVSQNKDTIGMSLIEEMTAGSLCSHHVDESIASPSAATSQSIEHSHQETTVQPPSREIVNPTHGDHQVDGSMASPSAVTSQSVEHSQQETTVQPPSRESVNPTHGDHHVDGSMASPSAATSQSVKNSHQETTVQPPSREIVNPTHGVNHLDLVRGSGTNGGPSIELPAVSQNGLAPISQVESFTRPLNQFLVQSEPNLAIAEGYTHLHVPPMHQISFRNSALASHAQSLQSELDALRKDIEQIVKLLDSKKSFLKSECERELEEIRKKYEEKINEAESAFMLEKTQVELKYKVASMQKTLSEALQFKCSDGRTSGNSSTNQGLAAAVSPHHIQQMHQVQARMRHPSATSLSSMIHPTTENAFSPVQNHRPSTLFSTGRPAMSLPSITSSSMQSHHRSSGPFASARPPLISSITPSAGSPRVGGEFRAPAPHLQPYRPPGSSAPRLPVNVLMPSQLITAPSLSSPPSVAAHQPSRGQLPEMPNAVPRSRLNLGFSAMELLMANGAKAGGSALSENASVDPSANRLSGNVDGVVLLSDDES